MCTVVCIETGGFVCGSAVYLGLLALVTLVPPGEVHVLAPIALPVTRPSQTVNKLSS